MNKFDKIAISFNTKIDEESLIKLLSKELDNSDMDINTSPSIDEGIFKKALPYIAAGLTGLGSAFGADTTTKQAPITTNQSSKASETDAKFNKLKSDYENDKKIHKKILNNSNINHSTEVYNNSSMDAILAVLIPAIAEQETGHFKRYPKYRNKAIGDKGKAFGKYQVHKIAIRDVNNYYGTRYKHVDMFNPVKAEDVLRKYLTYWGNENLKHKGIPINYKTLSAVWNGGPSGNVKHNALDYANDVVRIIQRKNSNE